jgi:hypothetical protein
MFFFKQKEITLDCFTSDENIYNHARISPSKDYIPKWWRDIPLPDKNVLEPEINMRHCAGFIDQFMNTFALPLWSDVNIEVGAIGEDSIAWQFSYERAEARLDHYSKQWGDFVNIEEFAHIKLMSPWFIKSEESVKVAYTEPTWNILGSGLRVLPAIMDFKYQHGTNANIFIARKPQAHLIQLSFSTPIAHFVPLTERKVKLKHHLVSPEEIGNLIPPRFKFNGAYFMNKSLIEKKSPSKCPFNKAISKLKGVNNE